MGKIYIGTASWNIPKDYKDIFSEEGTHLQKYAEKFNAVEINSSFYRDHQYKTYQKWASMVPQDFRFSVKLSKVFTHEQRLKKGEKDLSKTLNSLTGLGEKWGVLLVQLPPSLAYHEKDAFHFFQNLREIYQGSVAFEPRHVSWLKIEAQALLNQFKVKRVFADPEAKAANPVWSLHDHLFYYRLHGTPEIYKSNYDSKALSAYANNFLNLIERGNVWCIFDNTTFGYATKNALQLQGISP